MIALEIKNNYEGLYKFKEECTANKRKFPTRISLMINRNIKNLQEVYNDIEDERINIITKYADRDEDGNVIYDDKQNIHIEDLEGVNKELSEMFDTEIDVHIDYITDEDLEKCDLGEYDSLSFDEVSMLSFMIK